MRPAAVLEDAGDSDGDVAAGECGGIFADDHSAVIEVSDTLAGAITIPDDANIEAFAGDIAWLQGVCDVIKIDDRNALHAGNFVEVEIIGDDTAAHLFGEPPQLFDRRSSCEIRCVMFPRP